MLGSWMCIAFININDKCLKDYYSLSSIDQIINAMILYGIMSFLDAYLCYH